MSFRKRKKASVSKRKTAPPAKKKRYKRAGETPFVQRGSAFVSQGWQKTEDLKEKLKKLQQPSKKTFRNQQKKK